MLWERNDLPTQVIFGSSMAIIERLVKKLTPEIRALKSFGFHLLLERGADVISCIFLSIKSITTFSQPYDRDQLLVGLDLTAQDNRIYGRKKQRSIQPLILTKALCLLILTKEIAYFEKKGIWPFLTKKYPSQIIFTKAR